VKLYACCVLVSVVDCSGFPCEDPASPAVWSMDVPVTANNSTLCSCDTGFQQCSSGLYNVIHVSSHILDSVLLRVADAAGV